MPDAENTPIIQLSDVSLTLRGSAGPVNILRSIDLTVARGECVSIMGASGAGKTSLLMVLSGLERVTSGTVAIDGQDIGRMSENRLARFRGERIGIVFQGVHLVDTMTALENVALPLELAGRCERRLVMSDGRIEEAASGGQGAALHPALRAGRGLVTPGLRP